MTVPIRVLLADDDPLVLSGLKMMLTAAKQIQVVGEAHDGREVLPAADLHHPDIVLMDIRMPRLDGIAATRLLRTQPSPPQVIVLTTFDADELVLRALQAGAAGFLLKDTAHTDIVAAIQAAHADDGSLSPAVARRLISLVAGDPDTAARQDRARRLGSLTPLAGAHRRRYGRPQGTLCPPGEDAEQVDLGRGPPPRATRTRTHADERASCHHVRGAPNAGSGAH